MKQDKEIAVGSSFDSFLESDGILSEVTALAHKRVLSWQIEEAMKSQHITQKEMSKKMGTSRTVIHRLLDPNNPSITLLTIDKAVNALGMRLNMSIMPMGS